MGEAGGVGVVCGVAGAEGAAVESGAGADEGEWEWEWDDASACEWEWEWECECEWRREDGVSGTAGGAATKGDESKPRGRRKRVVHGRQSKIGSLPAQVREELNGRLYDGQFESQILPWLNALPDVQRVIEEQWDRKPVDSQGLSTWRKSGYREWLAKRERAAEMKLLSSYALQMAQAAGTSVSEGAAAIAGGRILELLEQARGEDLVDLSMALAKLRDSDAKLLNARTAEKTLPLKKSAVQLARQKFERETAELFMKWFEDEEARRIMALKSGKTVKMDQLVTLIFGRRPTTPRLQAAPVSGSAPPAPGGDPLPRPGLVNETTSATPPGPGGQG